MTHPTVPRPSTTAETLQRLEDKLDRLERTLGPLAGLAEQAPAVVAAATDAVDARLGEGAADFDARLRAVGGLLERVSRPQTLATLHGLVRVLDSAPGLLAALVDALDAAAGGLALDERVTAVLGLLHEASEPQTLRDRSQVVRRLLGHLRAAEQASERRVGLWGLLRSLRDPDTQRAIGFALHLIEGLGRDLSQLPSRSLPA